MKCYIDNSVIICDEIIDTPHTVSINSDINKTKYKMDYYILHTFLLVTILLLNIVIICYHYTLPYS